MCDLHLLRFSRRGRQHLCTAPDCVLGAQAVFATSRSPEASAVAQAVFEKSKMSAHALAGCVWPLQVVVLKRLAALPDGKYRPLTGEQSVVASTFEASRARGTSMAETVRDLLLQMTNQPRALDAVSNFLHGLHRALLLKTGFSRVTLVAAIAGLGEKQRDESAIAGKLAGGAADASASFATANATGASAARAAAGAAGASAAKAAPGAAGASTAGPAAAAAAPATESMPPGERAGERADGLSEIPAVEPKAETAMKSAGDLAGVAAGKMDRDLAGDPAAMKENPSTRGSVVAAIGAAAAVVATTGSSTRTTT